MVLTCEKTTQRIWSVVADGFIRKPGEGQAPKRVFIKQFLDCTGKPHPKQWENETKGYQVVQTALRNEAIFPELIASAREQLVHVYQHLEIDSIDEILRADSTQFEGVLEHFLREIESLLRTMQSAIEDHDFSALAHKSRDYIGSPGLCFKGLDVRNFGFERSNYADLDGKRLVMFDFGKPYVAPIHEAAAKVFVSIGLLNWGRPISRFAKGPDQAMIERALEQLKAYIHPRAIQLELDMQYRFRSEEIRASGTLEKIAKQTGIKLLGGRYFKRLRRWCDENISTAVAG